MIFLLFIFIPIIEIAIFITVGSNIGILNTIAIILITALAGIYLVRKQGLSLLFNAQRNLSQGALCQQKKLRVEFFTYFRFTSNYAWFFYRLHWLCHVFKTCSKFCGIKSKKLFSITQTVLIHPSSAVIALILIIVLLF